MMVRIGIPPYARYGSALKAIGATGLISANALRRRDNSAFSHPRAGAFGGLPDIALDSAGFVAMVRYKGYRWSVEEYVALAGAFPWAWWASMDYCCEPEIAGDRRAVLERVKLTAMRYPQLGFLSSERGIKPPMPVLQGWKPDDYALCADMTGELPELVGVGSVCRRDVGGPEGILAILARLDAFLPTHVRLHLFGVKGDAIPLLLGHPRIHSVDSMAWDYACRREIMPPRTVAKRVDHMVAWWRRQTSHENLFGRAV